jgi:hypothetical protein
MSGDETKIVGSGDDSGENNPLIPDKIEKDLKKSKFGRWILWACSLVLVPLIGWAGNETLAVYNSFDELRQAVRDLQHDKTSNDALWKSLGDQRNQLIEVRIRQEAASRLFEREFSKSVLDRYIEFKLAQEMAASKAAEPTLLIPFTVPVPLPVPLPVPRPVPLPPNVEPKGDKPDLKLIDPDQYRKEQEQKFPRPNAQQKK